MEKNELTQYLEEAEGEESAKGIEAQIKEVDSKLKTTKEYTRAQDQQTRKAPLALLTKDTMLSQECTTLGIIEQLLPAYLIARHGERRKEDDVHIYIVNWVRKRERRKEEDWMDVGQKVPKHN